jgi:hypothetical protein
VIKKQVTLEERVPELKGEDLNFVRACLSINPKMRPTTKDLMSFKYLSVVDHPILQEYEDSLKR